MPVIKAKKVEESTVEKVYKGIFINGTEIPESDLVIDEEMAKGYLGWEEETDAVKFGSDFLVSVGGKKCRAMKNLNNRPLDEGHCRKLAQDILNGHWQLNCETIIVGENDNVVSGQHRLVALIMACDAWRTEEHWRTTWPDGPPTIMALVAFGCSEDKAVTRTIDNVKPRTLSDVLFADSDVFGKVKVGERKAVCKAAEFAVRFVCHRTGAKNDAYSPYLTHSELLEYIARHPRLLKSVKHVHEQNSGSDGKIASLVSVGKASGLHYLMSGAATDAEKFEASESSDEKAMDFKFGKKADEFWAKLAVGEGGFEDVRRAINYMKSDEDGASEAEVVGMLVNAWIAYVNDRPVNDKTLGYEYDERRNKKILVANGLHYQDASMRKLEVHPSCGGIDLGDPDEAKRERLEAERYEREQEKARIKKANKALKNAANMQPDEGEQPDDAIRRIRREDALFNATLLFPKPDDSGYTVYGSDAQAVASKLGGVHELRNGLSVFFVPAADMERLAKTKLDLQVVKRNPETNAYEHAGKYGGKPGIILNDKPKTTKPAEPLTPTSKPKPKDEPKPADTKDPAAKKNLKGGK